MKIICCVIFGSASKICSSLKSMAVDLKPAITALPLVISTISSLILCSYLLTGQRKQFQ